MKSSGPSRRSKRKTQPGGLRELILLGLLLALLSAAAVWFHHSHGYLLWYGDAEAHLNIARRVVDNRSPGLDQIGTVWLPLPHLLMLPFVGNDSLWRTGLAGAIGPAISYVLGGLFLFAAVRRMFDSSAAGMTAALAVALNPNLLYLQSIPMTESIFFGAVMALFYATVWYRQSASLWPVLLAGAASFAASMTRYEAWMLVPFAAAYFTFSKGKPNWRHGFLFALIGSMAPVMWLAHNAWHYGNPIEFYNGYYSPRMIYQRALAQNMKRFPGDHDLPAALRQFQAAAELCAGLSLAILGLGGVAVALLRRKLWPMLFLLLPPAFHVWSMYGGNTPIFVPHLEPFSYYNTRYGLALLPWLAVGAGALVTVAPQRVRGWFAAAVVLTATLPWIAYPRPERWITWKESQVNSETRRAWTREAADYLQQHYARGDGIYANFGDLTGILREAGIPIKALLHDGVHPTYQAVEQKPEYFLHEAWAIAFAGDNVSQTLIKAARRGRRYVCVKLIEVQGAPVIEIYQRADDIGPPKAKEPEPETEADEDTVH